jgi:acyl-CoA synthetase (NDP forming)
MLKLIIIISAGFSEESEIEKNLEQQLCKLLKSTMPALLAPNCIGVILLLFIRLFLLAQFQKFIQEVLIYFRIQELQQFLLLNRLLTKGLNFHSVISVGNSLKRY